MSVFNFYLPQKISFVGPRVDQIPETEVGLPGEAEKACEVRNSWSGFNKLFSHLALAVKSGFKIKSVSKVRWQIQIAFLPSLLIVS
jgi:hypothetical protein